MHTSTDTSLAIEFCLFFTDFSLRNLTLLNYTDQNGQSQSLRLKAELSRRWQEIGDLLGLSIPRLNSISKCHSDPLDCCREILAAWFEMGGGERYKLSWEGFMRLLADLQLNTMSKKLELALKQL